MMCRHMSPKESRSTVLAKEKRLSLSPSADIRFLFLDDCLYALQPAIVGLMRSNLHRCLQRHGISRLPEIGGDKPAKKKFKNIPLVTNLWTSRKFKRRKVSYLFAAIDRTSKYVQKLHERSAKLIGRFHRQPA